MILRGKPQRCARLPRPLASSLSIMSSAIPNVLAERYASPLIKDIWSPTGRIAIERDYWIAVMKAQRDLGLDIPAAAITAYEKVKDQIDLADIAPGLRITFSAGLVEMRAGEALEVAIERADQAMYRAKTGGRNRTEVD